MSAKRKEFEERLERFRRLVDAYSDGLANLQAMHQIFMKDFALVVKMQHGDAKQDIAGRMACRVLFANVEAIIFAMKRIALILSEHDKGNFSVAEVAMLNELAYELDDKGKARSQPKFIPLLKNLQFAFDVCARVFEVSFQLDLSDASWGSFQRALKVRNRITHPRGPVDLEMSDDDFEQLSKAASWFTKNFGELSKQFRNKIDEMKVTAKQLSQEASEIRNL
jgi:hypothetical protein